MEDFEVWRYDQIRIVDFYLLFFFRVKDIHLSNRHRFIKSLASSLAGARYEIQPSDRLIFGKMEKIQETAIGTLSTKGFFGAADFKRNGVERTSMKEPPEIASRIDLVNNRDEEIMRALRTLVDDYDLLGSSGLKARTGLLEYRYDAV
jgi:hypothetical protein